MNSPLELFIKRIKLNIAFQYKVLRTVVDILAIIYGVVPAIIVYVIYSFHLWSDKPSYLFNIPEPVVPIVLFILLSFHTFRSFYEYGDQLFLIQRKAWYKRIKKYGVYYSFVVHTLSQIALFSLLLPIIYIGQAWSLGYIILLCFFTGATTTCYTLIKRRLSLINKSWLRVIMHMIVFMCGLVTYTVIVIAKSNFIVLIALLIQLLWLYSYANKRQASYATAFVALTTYDMIGRYKNLKSILSMGDSKLPKIKNNKLKPRVFKQSNPFFKNRTADNILVESGLKQFVRNTDYLKKYVYFALVSTYPLFLLPVEGRIVYTLVFALIYFFVAKQAWLHFVNDDFIKLYKWDSMVSIKSVQKGSLLLAIPGYTLLFIVLLATSTSFNMLLLFIGAGLVGYVFLVGLSALTLK